MAHATPAQTLLPQRVSAGALAGLHDWPGGGPGARQLIRDAGERGDGSAIPLRGSKVTVLDLAARDAPELVQRDALAQVALQLLRA